MAADNRLTADELAALEPGDTVTVELLASSPGPATLSAPSSASPARTSS